MFTVVALRPGHYVVLAALALILFLPGFFSLPAIDRDEARFAQASRQMIESGDFVDIRFQDRARHKKPVGIYWLQSASAAVFGGSEAPIWAFRIPSLMGAVAAVLLTAWLGANLFSPVVGFLAALMLAGTILLGVEARLATTDSVLLAMILAAQGAFVKVYISARDGVPPTVWMAELFWVTIGLGILIKGPIILLVVGGTMVVLRIMDREARWAADFRPARGIAIVLIIVLPWLVAVTMTTHGAFLTGSLGEDLMAKVVAGKESHGAPPGYYLISLWVTSWPFGFLIAAALPWLWVRRRETAVRFVIAWVAPTWLVFELVPTKLPHYILPVFPALCLIAAAALHAGADEITSTWGRWVRRLGLALHCVVALALAVVLFALWTSSAEIGWSVLALVLLGVGIAIATAFTEVLETDRRLLGLIVASWMAIGGFLGGVLANYQAFQTSPRLAKAFRDASACENTSYASAGYTEPSLVFYAGTSIRLGDGAVAARQLLADPACAVAAVEARHERTFMEVLAEAGLQPRALSVVEGLNYARGGQSVRITLYRLP